SYHRVEDYALFFPAEDGIRYFHVTGVQTCALPILPTPSVSISILCRCARKSPSAWARRASRSAWSARRRPIPRCAHWAPSTAVRSEERRVGKGRNHQGGRTEVGQMRSLLSAAAIVG